MKEMAAEIEKVAVDTTVGISRGIGIGTTETIETTEIEVGMEAVDAGAEAVPLIFSTRGEDRGPTLAITSSRGTSLIGRIGIDHFLLTKKRVYRTNN